MGPSLESESSIEYVNTNDYYQGYLIVIEGPINPKVNSIEIIKTGGTTVSELNRLRKREWVLHL